MKNLFFCILSLSLVIACSTPPGKEAAREQSTLPALSHYGDSIAVEGALPITVLAAKMDSVDSLAIKLTGRVTSTCSKKGCWMKMALPGNEELRVTFKDYGFFIPTEGAEGKTAVIEGVAKKTVTGIADLKHYARDAGRSEEEIGGITAPREEIVFVATGVIIQD